MNYNNLKKIKIIKNDKKPVEKWSKKENQYKEIDTDIYNVGILTGLINNLVVLDIDLKNDGLNEFNKYFKLTDFKTPITSTPSGGYHIYFKYEHSNKDLFFLIENYLKTKSGFRNKGIDIRNNNGYVLAAPSQINNKKYTWINNKFNNIMELPEKLINWLLEGTDTNKENNNNNNVVKDIIYNITDEHLEQILKKIPIEYLNDYSKWNIVLSAFKKLNKFKIFDDWSKQSNNYNYNNNLKIWDNNNGKIDIGYINHLAGFKKISSYKIYNPLEKNIECKKYNFTNQYLNDGIKELNTDFLKEYNTIILKSTTGTGKTTYTAEQVEKIMKKNKKLKFISIVSKITLANQLKENFKNINLKSYLEIDNTEILKNNLVICINSILKLKNLTKQEMENYILYIDEVASFLESLTHNDTLKGKIKNVHRILINLIKHCKICIVSDALINDNVFDFLKIRDINKTVFIENEYIKYKNIIAYDIKDENIFYEYLRTNIINKKYFWFGCDSSNIITGLKNKLAEEFKDQKNDFELFTATSNNKITNINLLNNKYVFYSPSITYGVDFNIKDNQDVFIYIKGQSILSSGIFQQTTRTRQINNLYIYSKDKIREIKYNSLEDTKTKHKDFIYIKNQLLEEFLDIDEYGEEKINNQSLFFNLYCIL